MRTESLTKGERISTTGRSYLVRSVTIVSLHNTQHSGITDQSWIQNGKRNKGYNFSCAQNSFGDIPSQIVYLKYENFGFDI